jgi:hypothetical protein
VLITRATERNDTKYGKAVCLIKFAFGATSVRPVMHRWPLAACLHKLSFKDFRERELEQRKAMAMTRRRLFSFKFHFARRWRFNKVLAAHFFPSMCTWSDAEMFFAQLTISLWIFLQSHGRSL